MRATHTTATAALFALFVAGVVACGCRERAANAEAGLSLNDLPEIRAIKAGDYSALCEEPFARPGDAGTRACADGVRRAQMIVAACQHILSAQGLARESPGYEARLHACVMDREPVDAGLLL